MLQKFKAVEEIGRFSKLIHKAEPFAKLSLIFGRNGYGKSTLCSILRSSADGKPDHITARRRLGAVNDSRVESLWASGTTAYSAGKWNNCPGKIYIFDQEYVSKNVHVGDSVTRDNKRNLLPVVLGDEGVELAEKVVSLDQEQREVDNKRKDQSQIILARCKGLTVNEVSIFCRADVPVDLADKTRIAAQRIELIKQAAVVKQKKNPLLLSLGNLAQAEVVLAECIEGVSENATQLINKHLETHQLGDRANAWLEYGTTHAPENDCPFCAQKTTSIPLIAAYRAYFSDAFKALKIRVDEIWRVVDGFSATRLEELIAANDADFTYWANLCEIVAPTLVASERDYIISAFEKLKACIEAKRYNPLETVSFGADAANINQAIAKLIDYNKGVVAANVVIDKARAETTESDLQKAESSYAKWLALKEKGGDPVKSAVVSYLATEGRLEAIKAEKITAQTVLTTYTATTMATRQKSVNDLLDDFGANFRIIDAKTNFVGREPNTEFAIEIGTNKVKAGDKSETQPSFKTVLSTGDKTTLALAFFIAQIGADPSLKNAVIVFDDPFSSQDIDRQFQTTSHIRSICEKACQTIVLSHDPRFLQLIEKNSDNAITRTFQLQCADSGEGSMQAWSSSDELKSLYLQQSEMIREYATHHKVLKGQTLNTVHQAIRPFMEDYLRLRFPGRFLDKAHFFDMAKAIQDAGSEDPLAASVANLFALNEYTRPNMHGGGVVPVPGELRAHCRMVIGIVGSY
jgi:wobble nucleotide-excising tRNase